MYLKFLHLLLLALILQTSIIDCKKRRNLRKLQLGRSKSSNNSNSNSRKYSSSKSKRANGSSNSRRKSPKPKTLSWLYLANLEDCDQTFLSNQQKMFCQKYPLLFPTIKQAAKDTISSCVSIMSKRKWDCTQLQFEINKFETSNNKNVVSLENSNTNYNVVPELTHNSQPVIFKNFTSQARTSHHSQSQSSITLPDRLNSPLKMPSNVQELKRNMPIILRRDTSEAAFVEALAASILTHHIAQSCKSNKVKYCTCGNYKPSGKNKFTLNENLKNKILQMGLGKNSYRRNGYSYQDWSQSSSNQGGSNSNTILNIDGYKLNFNEIDPDILHNLDSCSDNIEFASKLTDSFINAAMDSSEDLEENKGKSQKRRTTITLDLGKLSRTTSPRQRILYHNTITGVNIVKRNAKENCECVGLGGTCNNQVCWKKSPELDQIHKKVLALYDSANYRVRYKNRKITATDEKSEKLTKRHTGNSTAVNEMTDQEKKQNRRILHERIRSKQALIYRVRKLDFCEADYRHGILGTRRRECSTDSSDPEYHCTDLCCDRGWTTQTTSVDKDCNCRYVWCCRVECEVCSTTETKHYCN